MQIVIDIDSYVLEHCKRHVSEHYANNIEEAIANGTPLPKGHGRLIDKDALGEKLNKYSEAPYQYALRVFNESPIIIKADKGE